MTFASQFFDTAVDAGIRVICPTDFIDTADEDWPERLHAALGHHGRANHFTRRRIKRAQENRWLSGAAMGPLAIGYRRRPIYRGEEVFRTRFSKRELRTGRSKLV